jgi:hypothetical protein
LAVHCFGSAKREHFNTKTFQYEEAVAVQGIEVNDTKSIDSSRPRDDASVNSSSENGSSENGSSDDRSDTSTDNSVSNDNSESEDDSNSNNSADSNFDDEPISPALVPRLRSGCFRWLHGK